MAQQVGPGQAAVAADHDQPVDAPLHEVVGGPAPALALAERHRAGGADHGAAAVQDVADVVPGHRADAVAPVDQALVALVDGEDLRAVVERGPDHGPDGRVHARGVAAAGQHGQPWARLPHLARDQLPRPTLCSSTASTSAYSGSAGLRPVIRSVASSAVRVGSSCCNSTLSGSSGTSKDSAASTVASRCWGRMPRSASSAAGPTSRSNRDSLRSGCRPTRSTVSGRYGLANRCRILSTYACWASAVKSYLATSSCLVSARTPSTAVRTTSSARASLSLVMPLAKPW